MGANTRSSILGLRAVARAAAAVRGQHITRLGPFRLLGRSLIFVRGQQDSAIGRPLDWESAPIDLDRTLDRRGKHDTIAQCPLAA